MDERHFREEIVRAVFDFLDTHRGEKFTSMQIAVQSGCDMSSWSEVVFSLTWLIRTGRCSGEVRVENGYPDTRYWRENA